MRFKVASIVAGKVALCAIIRFLPTVNKGMLPQITVLAERLVTLRTSVFDPSMDLLVKVEVPLTCKCLRTQVASYLVLHLQLSPPSPLGVLF